MILFFIQWRRCTRFSDMFKYLDTHTKEVTALDLREDNRCESIHVSFWVSII